MPTLPTVLDGSLFVDIFNDLPNFDNLSMKVSLAILLLHGFSLLILKQVYGIQQLLDKVCK